MNWIDISIIVILLVNIGVGWYKGLIRSVVSLISIVLGFIGAKMYHMEMYKLLNNQYDLLTKIKQTVQNMFSSVNFPETNQVEGLNSEQFSDLLGGSEYLKTLSEKFFESDQFTDIMNTQVSNFSDGFSTWLSENILIVLSMVSVFLIIMIGIRFAGYILDKIFEFPGFKEVNKLSGLIFGLVKGLFYSMLFVVLVVIAGSLTNHAIIETLEASQIGIYMYKYNIIMIVFEMMI